MIDALVAGRLVGQPQQRTGQSGKPFVTAVVRVPQAQGEAAFVSAIGFGPRIVETLGALSDGDSIAISGELTVGVFEKDGAARSSLKLVVHNLTTAHHVKRKRAVIHSEGVEA